MWVVASSIVTFVVFMESVKGSLEVGSIEDSKGRTEFDSNFSTVEDWCNVGIVKIISEREDEFVDNQCLESRD